jgi:hypothetical protein
MLRRRFMPTRLLRPASAAVRPPSSTRRQLLVDALAGVGALGVASMACATTAGPPAAAARSGATLPTGTVRDFDFLVGTWHGVNRRLKQRWAGSSDWDEFPGELRGESRMGGVVNITEVEFPTKGWSGVTVRTFDVEARRWSTYWINSRTGKLFPPVVGGFTGNRGEFYGDDTDDGRPVKVQYVWTVVRPDLVRWQQAFSLDGSRWETNWTVEHRRVNASGSRPDLGASQPERVPDDRDR